MLCYTCNTNIELGLNLMFKRPNNAKSICNWDFIQRDRKFVKYYVFWSKHLLYGSLDLNSVKIRMWFYYHMWITKVISSFHKIWYFSVKFEDFVIFVCYSEILLFSKNTRSWPFLCYFYALHKSMTFQN